MRRLLQLAAALAVALSITACAGVKRIDAASAVSAAKSELSKAEAVYAVAEIAMAGYKAFPLCGSPGAGSICYDLNAGQVVDNILWTLKNTMADLQRGLDAVDEDGKVDLVALTSAVVRAAVNANTAVARFRGAQPIPSG